MALEDSTVPTIGSGLYTIELILTLVLKSASTENLSVKRTVRNEKSIERVSSE
jgi:hypothetical protein